MLGNALMVQPSCPDAGTLVWEQYGNLLILLAGTDLQPTIGRLAYKRIGWLSALLKLSWYHKTVQPPCLAPAEALRSRIFMEQALGIY